MDIIEDVKKLTNFLENEAYDYESDASSVSSTEIMLDCERLRKEKETLTDLANTSSNITTFSDQTNEVVEVVYVTDEEQLIINECFDPDIKMALTYNIMWRQTLQRILDHLIENKNKYDELIKKYTERRARIRNRRSAMKYRLGIPYFKDSTFFPCPINEDYRHMLQSKTLLLYSYIPLVTWTLTDKYDLSKGVYVDICYKKVLEIEREIKYMKKKDADEMKNLNKLKKIFSNKQLIDCVAKSWKTNTTDELINKSKKTALEDEINEIQTKLDDAATSSAGLMKQLVYLKKALQHFDDEVLIVNTASNWDKPVDWLKISTGNLNGRHSDLECKAMWNAHLNPKYTKALWSETESEMLKNIADKYNYQNWEAIASELNVRRSAYACCLHFHSKVCERYRKDKWTQEEDEKLVDVINASRLGSRISWSRVSYFFRDRTKEQVYNRYRYCLVPNLKKGKFTLEEDILLLTLCKLFHDNTTKVKPYFPHRHVTQIRDRIITLQTDVPKVWTMEEDKKIIDHADKNGPRNWSQILTNRSNDCIRHRYNFLVKWFEENPNGKLEEVVRRKKNYLSDRFRRKRALIEQMIKKLLYDLQKVENKQSVLSLKHIQKWVPPIKRTVQKQKRSMRVIKKSDENILEALLHDFFKNTYRYNGRTKSSFTEEEVETATVRVEAILENLSANLQFPSKEEIQIHPRLDELDKLIIGKLITRSERRQNKQITIKFPGISQGYPSATKEHVTDIETISLPSTSHAMQSENVITRFGNNDIPFKIPLNPDTLIGYRGLTLHLPTIIEHARGYLQCWQLYENLFDVPKTKEFGLKHALRMTDRHLDKIDDDLKYMILNDRELFWNRFRSICWWPCLITNSQIEPLDNESVFLEDSKPVTEIVIEKKKRGRPKKNLYKIELMVEAKRAKKENVKAKQTTSSDTEEDLVEVSD